MANYLNPGNGRFREALNTEIYVDKTGLIGYTNGRIGKANCYICVSRPRGFGKTYAADMLAAYYSRGCDSRELFEGLNAAEDPTFEEHLNKYNVIYLDISNILNSGYDNRTVTEVIKWVKTAISDELGKEYPCVARGEDFIGYLNDVYTETGIPFVVIIDEYDAPIRTRPDDETGQEEYLRFLRTFLKGKTYIALCYMTGILPVKKMSQSGPNMFYEYGMTFSGPVDGFFGFTEDEVKALCGKFDKPYDEIKDRYFGYHTGDAWVYSPGQVARALTDGRTGPDDTRSEPYEDIAAYIADDERGVQEALMPLLAGKEVEVSTILFPNDTVHLRRRDDVLTLFIHLGYLTYDERSEHARIPNRAAREKFLEAAGRAGLGNCDEARPDSERVLEATMRGDGKGVARLLEKMDADRGTDGRRRGDVSLRYEAGFAYLAAFERCDVTTNYVLEEYGYADLFFVPLDPGDPSFPPMIVEPKTKPDARGDVAHALDGRYPYCLSGYRGEVVLVEIIRGVRTGRRVCKIRRVVKT